MNLKKCLFVLLIPLLFILAGCSAVQPSGTTASSTANSAQTGSTTQNGQAPNPASMPVEGKLAMGTLKLEGTDKAITAEQAKALLPLWKAVKSLSSSQTASADEVSALYTQIQEAMSAGQVQAIKDLNMTPEDTQALMQQYGVQAPQGGPSQSATRTANSGSANNAGQGGGPGGAGGPPPDGGVPGGQMPGGAQTTPVAGQARRPAGGGMNTLFVDPLITLLEKRASS